MNTSSAKLIIVELSPELLKHYKLLRINFETISEIHMYFNKAYFNKISNRCLLETFSTYSIISLNVETLPYIS